MSTEDGNISIYLVGLEKDSTCIEDMLENKVERCQATLDKITTAEAAATDFTPDLTDVKAELTACVSEAGDEDSLAYSDGFLVNVCYQWDNQALSDGDQFGVCIKPADSTENESLNTDVDFASAKFSCFGTTYT